MQNAPSSSDGADYICAYCKRHAYVGLFLTSKTVFQFKYSTDQHLGDGKMVSHDETLVTMVECRRWDWRCHSSSNSRWSAIPYPIDGAGCHQGSELPLQNIFPSERDKNKWNIICFQYFLWKKLGGAVLFPFWDANMSKVKTAMLNYETYHQGMILNSSGAVNW